MKYSIKYKTKHKTRKIKTSKNKTRKNKSKRSRKGKNRQRGGSEELAVIPFKMLEYPHGASSESQAAFLRGQIKNQEQYEMNKIGGRGGGEPQDTENVTAGKVDVNTREVPQFFPTGGIQTAYTSTDQSAAGNLTGLTAAVDSTYDHFATEQAGGIRKRKYYSTRRNRRY
jgi:hypothetical protein